MFLMRSKKLTEEKAFTHSKAEYRFRKSRCEITEAILLAGELDPRAEKYRGQQKKSEPGTGTGLRNHRGFLFGKPIVFLRISFSVLLFELPFETLQLSSHLIPFTLIRLSRRLNCLCRRYWGSWGSGLSSRDGRCTGGGLTEQWCS